MARIRRIVMPKNTQTKLLKKNKFYDKIKKFEKEKK